MIQHLQLYYRQKNFLKSLYQTIKIICILHPPILKKILLFNKRKKIYLNYIKII